MTDHERRWSVPPGFRASLYNYLPCKLSRLATIVWDRRSVFVVCQAFLAWQGATDHERRWSVPPGFRASLYNYPPCKLSRPAAIRWDRRSVFVVCQAFLAWQGATDHERRWSVPPGFRACGCALMWGRLATCGRVVLGPASGDRPRASSSRRTAHPTPAAPVGDAATLRRATHRGRGCVTLWP
jgi:hypothetical protein